MFEQPLEMVQEDDVLVLKGSVDEYSITALRSRLDELADSGEHLVVDVTEVDYLPSAGVGVLVRAQSAARGAGGDIVLLAGEGSPSQRILVVTGIPHVLSLAETRGDEPDPGSARLG